MHRLCFSVAFASLLAGSSVLAQTGVTDPVGVIKLTIPGATGEGQTSFSFKSLGLARLVEFQGVATSDVTVQGNQIVCAGAGWTENQFNGANGKYFLEILGAAGGPGVGTMYDIASTSTGTQTITLDQNLQNTISGKPNFRIRKHWTIASVFGATVNAGGLTGGTASNADTILVYSNGEYISYYYNNGGFEDPGWRKPNDPYTDQGPVVLYPDDGIVIARKQVAPATITVMGAVKTGQTSFPILEGTNILTNPYAAPMTLDSSKLYRADPAIGVAAGSSAASSDQVLIYNGSEFETYFYADGLFLGPGWRKAGAGDTDQGPTVLAVGGSFAVRRQATGAFNWVAPQHPASF